jgi:hypothetical protein
MYKSPLDPSGALEFSFDPLRPLHSREDSQLRWTEYPYKQVVLDRVLVKASASRGGKPSTTAVAGALLAGHGDETLALFELEQHRPREDDAGASFGEDTSHEGSPIDFVGWKELEQRFLNERAAFQDAKKQFLKQQKAAVGAILDGIAGRKHAEEELKTHEAWRQRQIIKRYPDGSKYDGDGVNVNGVLVPHGQGTLWVPEKPLFGSNKLTDMKRVHRYVGSWMNGLKHGRGTYYWTSGDSWKGNFVRDEMQGKGVYTISTGAGNGDGESGEVESQRVRYYDASRHICWGDELVLGCRLRLLQSRREMEFQAASAVAIPSIVGTGHPKSGGGTDYVIVAYDTDTDQHLLRKDESEDSRWVSLHNKSFQVVSFRPITRLDVSTYAKT